MAAAQSLSKEQYETLAAFRFALRRFLRFSESAAASAGCTPQQYQALLAIKGFPGRESMTVRELAERLQIKHHSAVGLIDRLAAERLVARCPSGEDRRRVQIRLAPRGERVIQRLAPAHREQLRRMGPEISRLLRRLGESDPDVAIPPQHRRKAGLPVKPRALINLPAGRTASGATRARAVSSSPNSRRRIVDGKR